MLIYDSIDPDKPNTAGIAIILNCDLTNTTDVKSWNLIPGHAILLSHLWHENDVITSLALYAPNNSEYSLANFYHTLADTFLQYDLPAPNLIYGDFNMVEEAIDQLPKWEDPTIVLIALHCLKALLSLQDGWHTENPDKKEYMYTHNVPPRQNPCNSLLNENLQGLAPSATQLTMLLPL